MAKSTDPRDRRRTLVDRLHDAVEADLDAGDTPAGALSTLVGLERRLEGDDKLQALNELTRRLDGP